MWLYLLATDDDGPGPLDAIAALKASEDRGETPLLALSPREDAPWKGGEVGEGVLLGTRSGGVWSIHASSKIASPATLVGAREDSPGWRLALAEVRPFDPPRRGADFGIVEAALPDRGQALAWHFPRGLAARADGSASEEEGTARHARVVRESSEAVSIDERGNLYRDDGTRLDLPGFGPEAVLRGLSDVKHGRVVPLETIRGRRR